MASFDVTPAVIADFRVFYPEFADLTKWPDATVARALSVAAIEVGGCNWQPMLDTLPDYSSTRIAWYSYAAHLLVMWSLGAKAIAGGGIPATPYAVSSKSVGDESTSYATPSPESGSSPWINWLNLTPYGMQFVMFRRRNYVARAL